jgi:hypothetical protein
VSLRRTLWTQIHFDVLVSAIQTPQHAPRIFGFVLFRICMALCNDGIRRITIITIIIFWTLFTDMDIETTRRLVKTFSIWISFPTKGADTTEIVPALTKVIDVALAGGGAKSINFQELAADLAQITFDYPFRIPPYFALVVRAISVLEGMPLHPINK